MLLIFFHRKIAKSFFYLQKKSYVKTTTMKN